MSHINSIPIEKLKTISNWRDASPGTLLQVTLLNGGFVVGIRCDCPINGNLKPCILLVDQQMKADLGRIVDEELIYDAAIVVSDLLEIQLDKPIALNYSIALHNSIGLFCESKPGSGRFFIKAIYGSVRGYVSVRAPQAGVTVGTFMTDTPAGLLVLGSVKIGPKL